MSPWTRVKRSIIVRIGEIRELDGWEHDDWPGYFFDRMIEQFRELLHLHEIEEEKRDEPQERASS